MTFQCFRQNGGHLTSPWPKMWLPWLFRFPCHATYQMKGNDFSIRPFSILDQLEVIRGNKRSREVLRRPKKGLLCHFCIVGVTSFHLICIMLLLKYFNFEVNNRSLEVIRDHYKEKYSSPPPFLYSWGFYL